MALITIQLPTAPNNGASDNKTVTPGGGDIYLQIHRGFNTIISQYRVDICEVVSPTQLKILTQVASGQYPSAANPSAPAPLYNLGAPAALATRCVTVLADSVSTNLQIGQVDFIVGIYQLVGGTSFRRLDWEADSTFAVQLQSRFEIQF